MKLFDMNIIHSHNFEEDLDIIEGYGRVEAYTSDDMLEDGSREKIGSYTYHIYNTSHFLHDQSLLMTADAISGDELFMLDIIMNGEHEFQMTSDGMLATIGHVFIEDKFDYYENEKLILQKLMAYFEYISLDYIAVIATKSESASREKKSVISFPQIKLYKTLGFEYLGGYEKKHQVWIKNNN